jgi:hypothetical protein
MPFDFRDEEKQFRCGDTAVMGARLLFDIVNGFLKSMP